VSRPSNLFRPFIPLLALAALLAGAAPVVAADLRPGWGAWWLPPVRSTHGDAIDSLFMVTFWITMVTFVAVELVLIVFLIKYRHRADKKKAVFTHGNTRLEMCWTLAPAVILMGLAVANKGVWDKLRFNPDGDRADRATILVIGQQFKWNVIYPGPDGKLGRYLMFPKPTDASWSNPDWKPVSFAKRDMTKYPDVTPEQWGDMEKERLIKAQPFKFQNVTGPAGLPYEKSVAAINAYIEQVSPLGKDFSDPDGADDDWSKTPGREINIPAGRPTEVQLSSKDVIHDFFLPNYRVKLDAVPGMRGKLVFTATMTSKQRETQSTRTYKIDELVTMFDTLPAPEINVLIDKDSAGAIEDPRKKGLYLYVENADAYTKDPKTVKPKTIIRSTVGFNALTKDNVAKLKVAGITEVKAYEPGYWDLVCEELCGQGHYTMQGKIVVLDSMEYNKQFEGGRSLNSPSTKPSDVALAK
jgi:heme/copper-type cytochrome/quinol oxidase subunit 2